MDEQANIGLVKQCYDAFQKGDVQFVLSHQDPAIEWRMPEVEGIAFTGNRHGVEQVAEFFRQCDELMELQSFNPREFIAQGGQVVALGSYSWVVRKTGAGLASEWAHVFTIRDGKITRFEEFGDTAKLADAFGVAGMAAAREAMKQEAGHAAPKLH